MVAQEDEKLHECRVLTAGADGDFVLEISSEGAPIPAYVLTGPDFGCMLGQPKANIQENLNDIADCHKELKRVEGELSRLRAVLKAETLASVLGGYSKEGAD